MLNEITTAIAQKLEETFGGDYEINIDEIKQDFKEPCFFIVNLQSNQKQINGDRYFREHSFDIHYYPKDQCSATREINKVSDQLLMAIEYIGLDDGLIRGTKMRSEVHDDVLHFFVNYDAFILKKRDRGSYMRTLTQQQRIKE